MSLLLAVAALGTALAWQTDTPSVVETSDAVTISTAALQATVRKRGYVSGVAGGSLLDRKTGFRDTGFGLDVVDWLMQPGSDADYRARLLPELVYDYGNLVHGSRPKRSVEGPQICTQAKELSIEKLRGPGFVAVQTHYRYTMAAPGRHSGSEWRQTIVFPEGQRYFLSCDRVTSANGCGCLFLRIDMPGHIRHDHGNTFSEVYLSYYGTIPASAFAEDFPPDKRFWYGRGNTKWARAPRRFIRAYHLRYPRTGKTGPWLAGMTLDSSAVYEAWCHQRGYVCMIEEIGGRRVRRGETFGAAYVVGFFDSIEEMNRVYDLYAGNVALEVDGDHWRAVRRGRAGAPRAIPRQRPDSAGTASEPGSGGPADRRRSMAAEVSR